MNSHVGALRQIGSPLHELSKYQLLLARALSLNPASRAEPAPRDQKRVNFQIPWESLL